MGGGSEKRFAEGGRSPHGGSRISMGGESTPDDTMFIVLSASLSSEVLK